MPNMLSSLTFLDHETDDPANLKRRQTSRAWLKQVKKALVACLPCCIATEMDAQGQHDAEARGRVVRLCRRGRGEMATASSSSQVPPPPPPPVFNLDIFNNEKNISLSGSRSLSPSRSSVSSASFNHRAWMP
jgi:hypothetical protein